MSRVFLYILLLVATNGVAQNPFMRHFSLDEGLPTNEVYHVMQDSKGFVWMSTSYGVVKYDGHSFVHYSSTDGLVDNTVFESFEDADGRVWFVSFSGALCSFFQDSIFSYRFNNQFFRFLPPSPIALKKSFYVDSLGAVACGIRNYGLVKVDSSGRGSLYQELHVVKVNQIEKTLMVSAYGICGNDSLYIDLPDIKDSLFLPDLGVHMGNSFILAERWQGMLVLINQRQVLYKTEGNWKVATVPANVIWSGVYEGKLWVGTRNGVYIYSGGAFNNYQHLLAGAAVSSVMLDREGGYWVSTLKSGVYYIPNLAITYIDADDCLSHTSVLALEDDSQGLWMGYLKGSISYLTDNKIKHLALPVDASEGILNLYYDSIRSRLWVMTDLHTYSVDDEMNVSELKRERSPYFSAKDIVAVGDSLWIAAREGVIIYNDKELNNLVDEHGNIKMRITNLYKDPNASVVYLSTLQSLWRYKQGHFVDLGAAIPALQVRVNDMARINDEWLVLGTNGDGLIFYNSENQAVELFDNRFGLHDQKINCLHCQGDSIVWVGTNSGLFKVELQTMPNEDVPFPFFSIHNGFPGQQINAIEQKGDRLVVATSKGLVFAPLGVLQKNAVPPKIFINEFYVQDRMLSLRQYHQIAHDKSVLRIRYAAVNYRNTKRNKYRYRMLGLDSVWNYTHLREIQYSTLPPGMYHFQVEACNEDGIWSSDSADLAFEVVGPFYFSWWFLISSMVIITALFYWLYKIRIKEIERRNQLLNSIQNYKQQILRQQMNPHFIFNTLNSIQYYLLDEDIHASTSYLAKFAKLMRMILDNSRETTIPIEDEIKALELYLELETLRFEDKVNYTILVDPKVNTLEFRIPSLLIQPFVENAIKHGLMHKKGPGRVKVEIEKHGTGIVCVVEDDGVGREKAARIRKAQHRSWGAEISEDRIRLLNAVYGEEVKIKVVDLVGGDSRPAGTRVEICIPRIHSF